MNLQDQESTNLRKYESKNPFKRMALEQFYQALLSMPFEAGDVLDAGCGEGFGASRLVEAFPEIQIMGVDFSESALHYSQKQLPQMPVSVSDVTRLPFSAKQFDMVVSLEVLEHLPRPGKAVQMYKQLAKRYLLLSVPNEPIFRTLRMLEGNDLLKWGDHPEHINHWNLFSFPRFLEKQGLRVVERKVPFPFTWVMCLCEIL